LSSGSYRRHVLSKCFLLCDRAFAFSFELSLHLTFKLAFTFHLEFELSFAKRGSRGTSQHAAYWTTYRCSDQRSCNAGNIAQDRRRSTNEPAYASSNAAEEFLAFEFTLELAFELTLALAAKQAADAAGDGAQKLLALPFRLTFELVFEFTFSLAAKQTADAACDRAQKLFALFLELTFKLAFKLTLKLQLQFAVLPYRCCSAHCCLSFRIRRAPH
jgi:hypothetical protein